MPSFSDLFDNPITGALTGGLVGGPAGTAIGGTAGLFNSLDFGGGAGSLSAGLAPLTDFIQGTDPTAKQLIQAQLQGVDPSTLGSPSLEQRVGQVTSGLGQNLQGLQIGGLDTSALDPAIAGLGLGAATQQQAIQQAAGLLQDPSSILNDPVIQAQLQRGIRSSEMGAAARGSQISGGQLRELQALGQEFAGTQITQQLSRLGALAGLGADQARLGTQAAGLDISAQQAIALANQQAQLGGAQLQAQTGLAGLGLQGELATQLAQAQSAAILGEANIEAAEDASRLGFVGNLIGGATSLLGGA